MSKFKKQNIKKKKREMKESDEERGYSSVIYTAIITGVLLIASLVFNGEIISLSILDNIILDIVEILIRMSIVLLFFLFFTISYGNYRDLVGKPINWKELTVLFFLSIIQSILNLYVFLLSLLGLLLILLYLYLIQE